MESKRRRSSVATYAEENSSDDDDRDGEMYLTPDQKRNKAHAKKKKAERAKRGSVESARSTPIKRRSGSVTLEFKTPIKRERDGSSPDLSFEEGDIDRLSLITPNRRGRPPRRSLPATLIVPTALHVPVAKVKAVQGDDAEARQEEISVNDDGTEGERTRRRRSSVCYVESDNEETMQLDGDCWITPKQKGNRNWEKRIKAEKGQPRSTAERRARDAEESDTGSDDDIPDPEFLPACRLEDTEECPYCSAVHYPKGHVCCDKGAVFIPPMQRLPPELFKLMFGNGVNAKLFRSKIISYNNAFAFASIQYNRIPAAPHGVQSIKVKGSPAHFPSCALPFANNSPVYGNVYLYTGQRSVDMRMRTYNYLNKDVMKILEICMNRDNRWASYYRTLGEIIAEEERKLPGNGSYVRMKIVNANDVDKQQLQGHRGIYRKVMQGGNHVALFFQASVEQDVKMPGLIIYPRRGRNEMLPLFTWDPKATSLCYPMFCPYGEFVFSSKMYPLMKGEDRSLTYMERLTRYAEDNFEQAELWEVDIDPRTLVGDPTPADDLPQDDAAMEDEEESDGFEEEAEEEEEQEDEEGEELFYDALVDDHEVGEEGIEEPAVAAPNYEIEEAMAQDMNGHENELDFDNVILPEEYPQEDEDEWSDASDSFYPRDGADNLPMENEVTTEPQEEIATEDEGDGDAIMEEEQQKKTGSRLFASLKQWATYIYQERPSVSNRFLSGSNLGQLFLIDNFMRMIGERYDFSRKKCGEFLTSTKKKLLNARQKLADAVHLGITIGAQFSIPHTVPGSPRWLQQKFENAIAMCNAISRPDLFITATCNVNWPEIKNRIPRGRTWADYPFLVNEVFKKKLDQLMDLLNGKGVDRRTKKKKKGLFGRTKWFTYSIEFQQRGPPHAHIVCSLKRKPKTVLQIDKLCQAYLPINNPELRKLVEEFMMHSPCEGDPKAYCREGLNSSKHQCSKGYPKCFNDTTKMGDRYYPELKRPNNGEYSQRNRKADNRYVVPYNTQLLSFWRGHINVEVISVLSIVKYIFKYLFKGFDRVLVEMATNTDSLDKNAMTIDGHLILPKNVKIPAGTLRKRKEDAKKLLRKRGVPLKDKNGKPTVIFDEFWTVSDMRAVTSCEAAWEFARYPRHAASHTVIETSIHAEGEERLFYKAEEQEEVLENLEKEEMQTRLKAWFELNKKDPNAHDYTFAELPQGYIYEKGEWRPRKKAIRNLVTRIKSVNPRYRELFAIRLLCANLKGITSFQELRTVNGIEYKTAVEAAYAHKLMNNETEWDLFLAEACSYDNPKQLRRTFCQIITSSPISKKCVRYLYEKYRQFFFINRRWEEKVLEAHALYHIRSYLKVHGATLEDYGLPPLIEADLPSTDLVDDSGHSYYTERLSRREAANLKKSLTVEQKNVFNEILNDISSGEQTAFFLQGSGGTGKTRIMKAIYHELRSQKKNVACVAQTGIAASLLPLGSTAHRQFKIPLSPEEKMNSTMDLESDEAEYIKSLDLVIWDEVTMADRRTLECVHKLLANLRYGSDNKIFGGIPFILSGDWKQTLPVVPEVQGEAVINYTAVEWPWWREIKILHLYTNMRARNDAKYAEYCAKIGTGELNVNPNTRSVDQLAPLPEGRLVPSVKSLINKIYGDPGTPASKRDTFRRSTILAVDNKTVFDLNNRMLGLLDTEVHTFKSIDEYDPKHGLQHLDPESYHLETPSGYPIHELKIKVGAVVILLRNLNTSLGLNNGTRLIVEEIGTSIVRCTPLNPEKHMAEEVLLHPILFTPSGVISREISFTRMQFPIRLAFAITCNKAQGQTLERCGLVLTTPCFAHGQYYVAVSRVQRKEDIFIYNASESPIYTNNVVFKQVLAYEATDDQPEMALQPQIFAGDEIENEPTHDVMSEDNGSGSDMEDVETIPHRDRADRGVSTHPKRLLESDSEDEIVLHRRVAPIIPAPVPVRCTRSKNTSASNRTVTPSQIPSLQNVGNTCYANATVQVLIRLWRNQILSHRKRNPYVLALKKIINQRGHKDALPLLQVPYLSAYLDALGQQLSAVELLTDIFTSDDIPDEFKEAMVHIHKGHITCKICGSDFWTGNYEYHTTLAHKAPGSVYPTFEEYMMEYSRLEDTPLHCSNCHQTVDHVIQWRVTIPPQNKYLAVEMGLFKSLNGQLVREDRIIGCPGPALEIFGKVFKPIAAVWHEGDTPLEGHYKAYIEHDGNWWECNDSHIVQKSLPRSLHGIAFMVLEKQA